MALAMPQMRGKDPEAEHSLESHLSHLICIGQRTLCSCPNKILDVECYSALVALARHMALALPQMRRKDSEAEHSFESHLSHLICIGRWTMCSCPERILDVE